MATRSTCLRRQVGAVIVRDKRILSTGYNGAPRGLAHCDETGCLREQLGIPSGQRQEICRGLHAEQNAIIQAALHGVSIEGGMIYVTHQPCITCAKMIINAGIVRVVCASSIPMIWRATCWPKRAVSVWKCGNRIELVRITSLKEGRWLLTATIQRTAPSSQSTRPSRAAATSAIEQQHARAS